ncbi:MAG: hypothetical protein ACXWXM_05425 [Actinomycetota bacterium]
MDCERILSGFLGQPTNAVSSLAFLVAATWILILALRGERTTRAALLVLVLAVAANAAGSFMRHGPNPWWAQWAHDVAVMAVLLFIAIHAFGRRRGWRPTVEIGAYAIGLATIGLGLAVIHGASDPFAGTLVAGAVIGEVAAVSSDRRPSPSAAPQSGAIASGVGLAAIALGGVAFLLGQTGSPLCRPDSLFQWHALWHVLVAISLAAYAYALSFRRKDPAASA